MGRVNAQWCPERGFQKKSTPRGSVSMPGSRAETKKEARAERDSDRRRKNMGKGQRARLTGEANPSRDKNSLSRGGGS